VCRCGFQSSSAEGRALEISYWEALRVWWRIYWPAQLVSSALITLFSRSLAEGVNQWRAGHPLEVSPVETYFPILTIGGSLLIGAGCLWLFAPRILGRAYQGFRLVACLESNEIQKLTARQRTGLWFFVWWRQLAGGLLAWLLSMPLNMLLGTMNISAGSLIAAAAGLFGVGPIIIKMLVGNSLNGVQFETRRPVTSTGQVEAAATLES
jgi:hypothetical protein